MRTLALVAAAAAMLSAGCAAGQGDDGLTLDIGPDGQTQLRLDGRALSTAGVGGFHVVEVLGGGKTKELGWFHGPTAGGTPPGQIRTVASRAGLTLTADRFRVGGRVHVAARVEDTTGQDRALLVSFVLPVRTAGATFQNTLLRSFRLTGRETVPADYDDIEHVGRFNGLKYSNCAFTALKLAGSAIAMAAPTDPPRLFLMKATPRGYEIEFRLGLSPATKKFPQAAAVSFVIYRVDPRWGIRDAADQYFRMFGAQFASRAKRHGNWGETLAFAQEYLDKRPEDFAFQLGLVDVQWRKGKMNPASNALQRKIGCYTFHHREPWAWWHNQHDPKGVKRADQPNYPAAKKQTNEQELAEIRKQAAGELPIEAGTNQLCGCPPRLAAQAAVNSYCLHYGEPKNDGANWEKLSLMRGLSPSYGCMQIGMNLDPELPQPNRAQIAEYWQFRFFFGWKDLGGADPHGISWDSLTDWTLFRWINFRREHFATTDNPLVFSPRDGRVGQLVGFSDMEFAKHLSDKVRARGGMLFVNTNAKESFFGAKFVDAFGVESTLDNTRRYTLEVLSRLRCNAYQKPVSFYKASATTEAGIRRGVLFGIFPGAAGVKESQRAMYRKYMPALRAMAEAGWEPLTFAAVNAPVLIERFGANATSSDTCYLALLNPGEQKVETAVRLDMAGLGWPGPAAALNVAELLEGRPIVQPPSPGRELLGKLSIGPGEALILKLTRPALDAQPTVDPPPAPPPVAPAP